MQNLKTWTTSRIAVTKCNIHDPNSRPSNVSTCVQEGGVGGQRGEGGGVEGDEKFTTGLLDTGAPALQGLLAHLAGGTDQNMGSAKLMQARGVEADREGEVGGGVTTCLAAEAQAF